MPRRKEDTPSRIVKRTYEEKHRDERKEKSIMFGTSIDREYGEEINAFLKKHNINPATLHHCALAEGKSAAPQYDVVFCARNFANTFEDAKKKGTVVLGLRNIMSEQEMERAMREADLLDG